MITSWYFLSSFPVHVPLKAWEKIAWKMTITECVLKWLITNSLSFLCQKGHKELDMTEQLNIQC